MKKRICLTQNRRYFLPQYRRSAYRGVSVIVNVFDIISAYIGQICNSESSNEVSRRQ